VLCRWPCLWMEREQQLSVPNNSIDARGTRERTRRARCVPRLRLHLNNVLAFILQMMPPHLVDFPLRNEARVDDTTVAVPVLMMRKIVGAVKERRSGPA
jgi:hypothetical protein